MSGRLPVMLVDDADGEVHRVIFATIDNQLTDGDPPEVAATLARLLAAGESRDVALRYIACALSVEFFEILEHDGRFDAARYARHLAALPELPYDEDEI